MQLSLRAWPIRLAQTFAPKTIICCFLHNIAPSLSSLKIATQSVCANSATVAVRRRCIYCAFCFQFNKAQADAPLRNDRIYRIRFQRRRFQLISNAIPSFNIYTLSYRCALGRAILATKICKSLASIQRMSVRL